MKLTVAMFKSVPVYVLAVILLIVLAIDFNQRIWQPVEVRASNMPMADELMAAEERGLQLPEILASWLQEHGAVAVENNASADADGQVQALPGSTSLDQANVRIRAVFVSDVGNLQKAVAIAEVQNSETGEVTRSRLREGEMLVNWRVVAIHPDRVIVRRTDADVVSEDVAAEEVAKSAKELVLYVFKPSQQTLVMPEVESEG